MDYGNAKSNLSEKEMKKTIPLIITTKVIKYVGVNLTKKIKVLYNENYTTLVA